MTHRGLGGAGPYFRAQVGGAALPAPPLAEAAPGARGECGAGARAGGQRRARAGPGASPGASPGAACPRSVGSGGLPSRGAPRGFAVGLDEERVTLPRCVRSFSGLPLPPRGAPSSRGVSLSRCVPSSPGVSLPRVTLAPWPHPAVPAAAGAFVPEESGAAEPLIPQTLRLCLARSARSPSPG